MTNIHTLRDQRRANTKSLTYFAIGGILFLFVVVGTALWASLQADITTQDMPGAIQGKLLR